MHVCVCVCDAWCRVDGPGGHPGVWEEVSLGRQTRWAQLSKRTRWYMNTLTCTQYHSLLLTRRATSLTAVSLPAESLKGSSELQNSHSLVWQMNLTTFEDEKREDEEPNLSGPTGCAKREILKGIMSFLVCIALTCFLFCEKSIYKQTDYNLRWLVSFLRGCYLLFASLSSTIRKKKSLMIKNEHKKM